MGYTTQSYLVSGLCQSFGILNTRKHNDSETGSVSILRWGVRTSAQLGRSVGQFILVSGPLWGSWPDFKFLCVTITFFLLNVGRHVICSAITHRLKSHRTHNHILLSHLRLPQPGGPDPLTHIPHEQGGPAQSKKSVTLV
jgi:hypothetical protein